MKPVPPKARAMLAVAGLVASTLLVSPQSAAGAAWVAVTSDCGSGGVDGWSIYTWCYGKKKLSNDGSGSRDYFTHRMTISANSTNGRYMAATWVEPYPGSGSASQSWEGTDPFMPDRTISHPTNCKTITWTVGGGDVPFSYSESTTTCKSESFGPKLYADPGHHAGKWTGCASSGVVKKAFANMVVRVPQGGTATWYHDRRGVNAYNSSSSC